MARVITLARHYLQGHPKAGQPTYFVSSLWNSLYPIAIPLGVPTREFGDDYTIWELGSGKCKKHHTIRFGRRWKTGDKASLRVWSGKPYASKQIAITPDVTLKVINILVDYDRRTIFNELYNIALLAAHSKKLQVIAANDGLSPQDFLDWFQVGKKKGVHKAQILIWGDVKEY